MDRGAWRVTVHRVTKSQTRLKRHSMHTHAVRAKTDFAGRLYQMPALLAWSLLPAPQWQHFLLPLHCFPSSFRLLPFFVPSLIQLYLLLKFSIFFIQNVEEIPGKLHCYPKERPCGPLPPASFLLAFLMDSPWLSLCSYYGLMWPLQCPKDISGSWGWEYYHFCPISHHMFFVVVVDNCICSFPRDSDDCSSKWSLPLKLWLLFIWQSLISSERTGV